MNLLANAVLTAGLGTAPRTSHVAAPIEVGGHTMAPDSLLRYLQIKVHHLIQDRDWDSIRVVGGYDRQAVTSAYEKSGKLFNVERPTAQVHGRDLVIKAFPGTDYVNHYALVIATYLAMMGRPADVVSYEPPDPAVSREAVTRLDLDLDGDLVIVGWGLARLAPAGGVWIYETGDGQGYAWQRTYVHGRRVVYLGFLHSIWGDVAGRVVTRLAELGAGDIVYVGKVGALDAQIEPNTRLATGNTSLVGGTPVTWHDFFDDFAIAQPGVHTGTHVTSPSILLENRNWLTKHTGHAFVDPEIGPMGAAAHRSGIGFGYLHVISNNLARHYPADLSNERRRDVIRRRAVLLTQIHHIIAKRLAALPVGPDLRNLRRNTAMSNAAQLATPTRGREITIVGIDGAGKSTLAARLHQALNDAGHKAILVGKHSTDVPMDPELSAYVDRVNALVYRRDARVAQACGDHYWLLALAAWYTLQDKLVIHPALAAGTHVILDNAHHKILARYAVNPDVSTSLADQVFAHLTEPDLVYFLHISARDALARKGEFSSLETGHSGSGDENFIRYQDIVLAKLREHEQHGGWLSIDVTDMDRDAVFKTAAAALTDRLQLTL